MDWDNELLNIHLELAERETDSIILELEKMYDGYQHTNACFDCGAWAITRINGTAYCESCYMEHTGQIKHEVE